MVKIIGLMSGTSLDGLDLCFVHFNYKEGRWSYKIVATQEVEYPQELKSKLATIQSGSAQEYAQLHSDYGLYLGERVADFIAEYNLEPDYIASHGHTIFHQPAIRFTAQIGSGAAIAAVSGVDTICDFRTTDVALFGQGAPLVPIGDRELFAQYDYCLNLGGFSNISFERGESRVAYDISPVNYVLNHYTRQIGLEFDRDGELARSGTINQELLKRLNELEFYTLEGPKSLGREWVEEVVIPLIDSYQLKMEDKLATFTEHVAMQIARHTPQGRVLLTGGGALNRYLVERFSANSPKSQYLLPDELTIKFKEALIFAFLGALYIEDSPNSLKSVTGAKRDSIGGALYRGELKFSR